VVWTYTTKGLWRSIQLHLNIHPDRWCQQRPKVTSPHCQVKADVGKSSVRIGKPDAEMVMLTYFRQKSTWRFGLWSGDGSWQLLFQEKLWRSYFVLCNDWPHLYLTNKIRNQVQTRLCPVLQEKISEAKSSSFGAIKNIKNNTMTNELLLWAIMLLHRWFWQCGSCV
jgi:hypothetical protein